MTMGLPLVDGASLAAPPALRVRAIRRAIAGRQIVDGVDLDVGADELVVLVGPSGCGKSTLLRGIAGLDAVDGTVEVAGRDVSSLPPERRHIGLVFQDHALFPHLRVEKNLTFGVPGLSGRERSLLVDELLELVRLPGVGRRFPHELSGGEQQRVALARALAPRPPVVLLDEPFANLDASLRDELRRDVIGALRERRTTAVLVTHDRDEALQLGDRVAVMRAGRILQIDRPETVYEAPADRFVAGFLGDAAFCPADDGGVVVARPHQLTVSTGGDDRVTGVRYLGAVRRYEVARTDGTTVQADVAAGAPVLPVGSACSLHLIDPEGLHRLS